MFPNSTDINIANATTRPFMVVVHDVAAPFATELCLITHQIGSLIGDRFACAVTPRWKGNGLRPDERDSMTEILDRCGELMVHGLTHHRQKGIGIRSALSGRSDEFTNLSDDAIEQLVSLAQLEIHQHFGTFPRGLLPPAWSLPTAAERLTDVDYVLRFGSIESCHQQAQDRRLATFSYDWGWLAQAAWAGDWLGRIRMLSASDAIPCVAVHPVDSRRGWMPRILRLIRYLLDCGYQAMLPRDVFSTETFPSECNRDGLLEGTLG